jgi:hypothetical protein
LPIRLDSSMAFLLGRISAIDKPRTPRCIEAS